MSSNNNDDKSEKNNININAENSQFKSDFFDKPEEKHKNCHFGKVKK